jgi:hypothetical protein
VGGDRYSSACRDRRSFLIDQAEVLSIAVADLKLGDYEPHQLIEQRTPQAEGKRELRAVA